jgi:hypothetical protein
LICVQERECELLVISVVYMRQKKRRMYTSKSIVEMN